VFIHLGYGMPQFRTKSRELFFAVIITVKQSHLSFIS